MLFSQDSRQQNWGWGLVKAIGSANFIQSAAGKIVLLLQGEAMRYNLVSGKSLIHLCSTVKLNKNHSTHNQAGQWGHVNHGSLYWVKNCNQLGSGKTNPPCQSLTGDR